VTIVAEPEGRIVGMLHLKDNQHIAMLFVECGNQRKGVGRGPFRLAKEHAPPGDKCSCSRSGSGRIQPRVPGIVKN
jgi:hypothetical protein